MLEHLTNEQLLLLFTMVIGLGGVALVKSGLILWALKKFWCLGIWLLLNRGPGVVIGGVRLSDKARGRHTHILGASGTGKTVFMEHLLRHDIANGCGALVIDPKGDRALYQRIKAFCKSVGREQDLFYLSATYPDESSKWNPCRIGTPGELQTKFLNSQIFSEPHYQKACEAALLKAFLKLEKIKGFTITDLVTQLNSTEGKEYEIISGLRYDLFNLTQTDWASLIHAKKVKVKRKEISLPDITQRNQILFLDLPTQGQTATSQRIGRLILQEILLLSGLRTRFPHLKSGKPFSIFVDEFEAFATESFVSLLNQGRSSGWQIHIAHQTLSDLKKVSETFSGQVMGLCNIRAIFRMDHPEDCEMIAKLFGTQEGKRLTYQTQDGGRTGMGSDRTAQEFRISPNKIRDLRDLRAIINVKTDGVLKEIKLGIPKKIPGTDVRLLDGSTIVDRGEEFVPVKVDALPSTVKLDVKRLVRERAK